MDVPSKLFTLCVTEHVVGCGYHRCSNISYTQFSIMALEFIKLLI